MSGTDNYEFSKSSLVQGLDKYSPYSKKDFNFINDINSSTYTNSSLSLVQFDLTSIYNASRFSDTNDLFITLPIVITAAFSTGGALVAPVAGNQALCTLKTNFANLIHQADITIAGQVVEQVQPYLNKFCEFKLASEMSQNDLKSIGQTLGFSDNLDNPLSVIWNNTAGANGSSGNGLNNNRPFLSASSAQIGSPYSTRVSTSQNSGSVNTALAQKVGNIVDTTQAGFNSIYQTANGLMTPTQLANEFKGYYTVLNTNYMVWYDIAVIRLPNLFDSLANIGLSKRLDMMLRLYINTGIVNVSVGSPNTDNLNYSLTNANTTFTNSCPLVINHLLGTSATGGIPATTTNIVASLTLARNCTTSFASVNLANAGASHPMTACRCYYSQIEIKPQLALKYIEENRNKKVVYRSILTSTYNNISSGSSFSQLIQSGVTSPVGLVILPFVSSTTGVMNGLSAWQSPFDTNIAHPISLTNLQVAVGGQNQLSSTLYYTYENFLEQVNLFESLTSADFGVSVGLINRQFWDINRTYFVNLSRSNTADQLTPRNIQISFNNNSAVSIDCLVFVVYLDEIVIDCETGLVKRQ